MGPREDYRPSLDDPNAWVPYRYVPSAPAAIVFVIAFSLTTFFHLYQLVRKRTWYFIPLLIGGFFELVGYIGRIISHNDLWKLGPFIMQSLLLLVAPALFAASIYIILGRVILLVDGERYSLIRQKWLTTAFVTGGVFSFLIQSSGGGIQAMGTLSSMPTGETLIVAGLFLQLFFFGFFGVVAIWFHWHVVNDKPSMTLSFKTCFPRGHQRALTNSSTALIVMPVSRRELNNLPWKRHIYALYAGSTLIMIRSIFRVIEYLQGNNGYLLKHEVFLYVFDAVLMLLAMIIFNWVHPSEVTETYQRRKLAGEIVTPDLELQGTRERYLGNYGRAHGKIGYV